VTSPRHQQWFHFGPWVFAIDAADALITATPRDTRPLDVTAWATTHGLTHLDDPNRRTVSLIGPASHALDRDYATTADLTKPVIVAQLSINGHPPVPLLIDGTHRLYRAWRERVPQLPTYLLTVEKTRQIQDNVLLGPGRTSIIPPPT
jgi:hypothetical protein